MISTNNFTIESAWQKRFKFGLATVDVVAINNNNGILIIKDPVGINFVKEDGNRIAVLGYNVNKKTLRRFLEKYEGDGWTIRRPQDLNIVNGVKINGRVYEARPTTLSTLYPGTLLPVEG